jgi:hypothetical protein
VAAFALATALVGAPRQAVAQGGTTQPASAAHPQNPFAPPPPSAKRVSVSKAVFGDAGVILNARDDGFIEVAAAGPSKTVFLQLRTSAARSWLDSTQRMLKARVKKADPPRTFRSDIAEYPSNTTMALTRSVTAGESEYALAFAEKGQSAFTIPIESEEADVFVAIIRKAIAQAEKLLEKTDTSAVRADSVARADSTAKADSIAAARKKRAAARRAAAAAAAKDSGSQTAVKKDTTAKPPAKPPAPKPQGPS